MSALFENVQETLQFLKTRTNLTPTVGLILGSGLGGLTELMRDKVSIDYAELPHFPRATVAGHAGQLVLGKIGQTCVLAMHGRFHYYEGHDMRSVGYPLAVMKGLGVKTLLVSNAAGGINPGFFPGDLMLITDHINLFASNPLIGPNDERFGPRFPDMTDAYSPRLIALADRAAKGLGMRFQRGVYAGVSGPCYETAAEIRFLQRGGADAVGMSTVPEVIAARHLGLEVLGISCITNMATGIAKVKHSHEAVVKAAGEASERFCAVVASLIQTLEKD